MINFVKKYSKFLTFAGLFSLLIICYFQQKQNAELRRQPAATTNVDSLVAIINKLQHEKDSIYWEAFPREIELGRYQVAFEIFTERNPKAAEQYAEIISSETE